MQLAAGTVERAVDVWREWSKAPPGRSLSVVQIAGHTFVQAPDGLLERFEPAIMRSARLSYTDVNALLVPDPLDTILIGLDDDRLARMEAATPQIEWWEAVTWPSNGRVHALVGRDGELDAIAMFENWYGVAGHIGVVTRPDRRGAGRAGAVGAAAALDALECGLVPQWRARIGNDASQRVANRLGFVTIGIQLFVGVPDAASSPQEA